MDIRVIKNIIPLKIKNCIKSRLYLTKHRLYLWKYQLMLKRNKKQKIILIGTPEHGNLGDHAIAKAELKFLKDYFPATLIIEITGDYFRKDKQRLKKIVCKEDKIIITGGGFMGSLWPLEELMIRDVVLACPNNKIIIFPQTIYYEENTEGKKIYQESQRLYKNHNDLTICTRDKKSYDLITNGVWDKESFKSVLVPDIATYLDEMGPLSGRAGILLCLREDKERNISDKEIEFINEYVLKVTNHVSYTNTVIPKKITMKRRDIELESKFREFRNAKLVITDRLHGMIFAALTGTPCIAINNTSGKVSGVHHWLTHLEYVCCVDSVEDIPKHIYRLMNMQDCIYDNNCLQKYFQKLAEVI